MMQTQQQNNEAMAFIFQQMALCYRYLGGEQFRAAAYEKAATMLLNMQEDIAVYASDIKRLEAMGNIGVSIAKKITEYLQTGRIELFARLKKRVPYALLGLMDITGFGPATIRLLYNQCGIKDEEELVKALNSHRLDDVKGLGKRRIARMKVLLALTKRGQPVLLKDGCRIGAALVAILRKVPGVQQAELCGSIRRKSKLIGDIDILIIAEPKDRPAIVQAFISSRHILKVLVKGSSKASVLLRFRNIQVDIRLMRASEYGAALLYMTGSRDHTIHLRMIAKQKGYTMNEYGIFEMATHRRIAGLTEAEMYHALGLRYIPPELRLNNGEIEAALVESD